jgi:hypothetical protein
VYTLTRVSKCFLFRTGRVKLDSLLHVFEI